MTALYMFDDEVADGWAPFALSRPCGELRFGRWTLRERLERFAGAPVSGHLTRAWLTNYTEDGAPGAVAGPHLPSGATLWSARAIPEGPLPRADGPANLWLGDRLAGVIIEDDAASPDAAWLAMPSPFADYPDRRIEGIWLDAPWDLVSDGPARLATDLTQLWTAGDDSDLPDGCWKIGSDPVVLGDGARIEPGVLFDTREGPIELGPGVQVSFGARLAGPLYAGDHSRLLGGSISAFSTGPFSYARGEIEAVTALGYFNKAHDGFLGHAYLGRWVNLGAMTTNSDLKNNYGTIRVGPPGEVVDTGLVKLGCLIGDHAKTGIGVLLNTGAIVGAGSNLFGSTLVPKWVEPFSWGEGSDLVEYRRDAFLTTAARVVARRSVEPDARFTAWHGDVWDAARGGT